MRGFDRWLRKEAGNTTKSAVVPDSLVNELLTKHKSVLITDDYAPVDNLIAPIFEERFGYNRKS